MPLKNTYAAYGSVAKFFHWLIFLLLFIMIVFGYFLDDIPKEYKSEAYNIHKLTGLSILTLMLLRLFWAVNNVKPLMPATMNIVESFLAKTAHYVLYVIVIAMPLTGWIGSSAAGRLPHIGNYTLPLPLIPQDKALVAASFDMHSVLAITIICLVSLHALAAFYHHFVKKDDVLKRMLP